MNPTPSDPANYAHPQQTSPNASEDSPPSLKTSSALNLPGLGSNRNTSFLSLASLNLANSSSSLLGIFSAAMDSVPPTPVGTPPLEVRRERGVVEEVDKWGTVRSISMLSVWGYAFAQYLPSFPLPQVCEDLWANEVYCYHSRTNMLFRSHISRR